MRSGSRTRCACTSTSSGSASRRAPAGEADDLRKRLDDARQLGEALRAVAVVRAEHGAPRRRRDRAHRPRHQQGAGRQRSPPRARRGSLSRARAEDPGGAARDAVRGARRSRSAVVAGTARRRAPRPRAGSRRAGRAHAAACPRRRLRGRVVPQRRAVVHAGWRSAQPGVRARTSSWRSGPRRSDRPRASNGTVDATASIIPLHATARRPVRRRADAAPGRPVRRRDATSTCRPPAPPRRSGRRAT